MASTVFVLLVVCVVSVASLWSHDTQDIANVIRELLYELCVNLKLKN